MSDSSLRHCESDATDIVTATSARRHGWRGKSPLSPPRHLRSLSEHCLLPLRFEELRWPVVLSPWCGESLA